MNRIFKMCAAPKLRPNIVLPTSLHFLGVFRNSEHWSPWWAAPWKEKVSGKEQMVNLLSPWWPGCWGLREAVDVDSEKAVREGSGGGKARATLWGRLNTVGLSVASDKHSPGWCEQKRIQWKDTGQSQDFWERWWTALEKGQQQEGSVTRARIPLQTQTPRLPPWTPETAAHTQSARYCSHSSRGGCAATPAPWLTYSQLKVQIYLMGWV